MKNFFKKIGSTLAATLKRFTWFELLYISVGLIAVIVLSILLKSSAITIIYSLVGVLYVGCLAEQFKFAMILGVIQNSFYIAQSAIYKNWGEVILNAAVVLPILIVALISWFTGKDKKSATVKSNKIKTKEWICIAVAWVVIAVSFYFILNALNTSYVVIAALLCAFTAVANYLLLRKSQYSFVCFIMVNAIMFVLWLLPIIESGEGARLETLPMLVTIIIYTISNVVSLINWSKDAKRQKEENMVKTEENITESKENLAIEDNAKGIIEGIKDDENTDTKEDKNQ